MEKMIYSILSTKNNSETLNPVVLELKETTQKDFHVISFDELSAVVIDIKRADLIADRLNAIEYAGVIETLTKQFALLPMRFGSLMESTDAVVKMLERNYTELQQNLQKVEDKCEFGLKICCDSEQLKVHLKEKSNINVTLKTTSESAPKNSIFRDYVDRKLKEHKLEELLVNYIDSVIAEVTAHLTRFNAVNKFKKMVTSSTIIDAVFLLNKTRKEALIQAVEDLQKQYPILKFILTGPWPPFNFVDITIK